MKKIIALALAVVLCLGLVACGGKDPAKKSEGVLTYEEYMAAELETEVVVEAYVQATQSWWNDQITVYAADPDGGYLFYKMTCSEADAAKLTKGTKIRVSGIKTAWEGEVELKEGATFEFVNDGITYESTPTDVTAKMGNDEIIDYQNALVAFKNLTVVASKNGAGEELPFLYNWDGSGAAGSDSDLYFNATDGTTTYTFVIEYYLRNESTDAYKAVQAFEVGDTISLEGFLYWYDGPQTHVTTITVAD